MTPLPEELMREAENVWRDVMLSGEPQAVIARALLAERERAARIARGTVDAYRNPTDWDYGAQNACERIATAILTDKEPS